MTPILTLTNNSNRFFLLPFSPLFLFKTKVPGELAQLWAKLCIFSAKDCGEIGFQSWSLSAIIFNFHVHCALYRKLLWAFRLWNRDPLFIDLGTQEKYCAQCIDQGNITKLCTIVYAQTGTVAFKMTQHHFYCVTNQHQSVKFSWVF